MTRPASGVPEHPLVSAPGRDLLVTAVLLCLTAAVLVAVAVPGSLARLERLDRAWLDLMVTVRTPPATAAATALDVLGLVYVTVPVRVALAAFLAVRRRWWHLAAFVTAVVMSEILIGTLKAVYDRPRPPGSLVGTSGASFPSGHSVAASVTVVASVIALVPPGRARAVWGTLAVAFSVLMALSRAYLGAHWLTDAVAGVLVGTSCALAAALLVGTLQNRSHRHDHVGPRPARDPGAIPLAEDP